MHIDLDKIAGWILAGLVAVIAWFTRKTAGDMQSQIEKNREDISKAIPREEFNKTVESLRSDFKETQKASEDRIIHHVTMIGMQVNSQLDHAVKIAEAFNKATQRHD